MNRRAAALFLAAVTAASAITGASSNVLPIYIEDNHAGSSYWLAQILDLDEPCTLIHFDAHSDASAIFDSDRMRDALRRVASLEERQQLLDRWRSEGCIQCFNWIEPLMPTPIAKVIWVPGARLADPERKQRQDQAIALLDGHLEAAPRKTGTFRDRYIVSDLEHLPTNLSESEPLIVTIDLDYFSGLPSIDQDKAFQSVWNFVLAQRNLRAVTFAISRPYLADGSEADRLLKLALDASLLLPTARIQFEPFAHVANDRSTRAQELKAAGRALPSYDIERATEDLRARLLSEKEKIVVQREASRWKTLLRKWQDEAPQFHLEVKGSQPSTDGVWRVSSDEHATVEVVAEPWMAKPDHAEWFVLTPRYLCCNVTDLRADQAGFVANAAPRPTWQEIPIPQTDGALPIRQVDRFFDRQSHGGSLRLRARVVVDGKMRETPTMELRRLVGRGFRAALTEQFGLPYLFGSGELSDRSNTGPETNLGADCANFIVYAMRRQGLRTPWSDPKQLRRHLELVELSVAPGAAHCTNEDLERGLVVHLGTHLAAVMEDRTPLGVLDGNDVVAHQLKGIPENLTLGALLRDRHATTFDLFRVPGVEPAATLVFGGDVMLGRTCAAKISRGIDPFAGIRNLLAHRAFVAANLECTIADDQPTPGPRHYSFLAPLKSASLLRAAGFDAVSLANNHTLDYGAAALRECVQILSRENVRPVGVGKMWEGPQCPDLQNAFTPEIFSLSAGQKLAVLAISDVPLKREHGVPGGRRVDGTAAREAESDGDIASHSLEPTSDSTLIALAANRARLAAAIEQARVRATIVACMVHWGEENTRIITARQRELARWLIDHGVDLVIGSHPHCVQPLDFYHGRTIAYSLGNLVFDGAQTLTSWNHGALLEIGLSDEARMTSTGLVPIVLKEGLPEVATLTNGVLAQQ